MGQIGELAELCGALLVGLAAWTLSALLSMLSALRNLVFGNQQQALTGPERDELLAWARGLLPGQSLDDFGVSWSDGVALRRLVERLVPAQGTSPGPAPVTADQPIQNVNEAFRRAKEVLQQPPTLTVMDVISGQEEARLTAYLTALREAAEHQAERSSRSNSPASVEEERHADGPAATTTTTTSAATVAGEGLTAAQSGHTAQFAVHLPQSARLDLLVEMRSEAGDYFSQRLTPRSPPRRGLEDKAPVPATGSSRPKSNIPVGYQVTGRTVNLWYQPPAAGWLSLSVVCGGQHVEGSPFKVYVGDNEGGEGDRGKDTVPQIEKEPEKRPVTEKVKEPVKEQMVEAVKEAMTEAAPSPPRRRPPLRVLSVVQEMSVDVVNPESSAAQPKNGVPDSPVHDQMNTERETDGEKDAAARQEQPSGETPTPSADSKLHQPELNDASQTPQQQGDNPLVFTSSDASSGQPGDTPSPDTDSSNNNISPKTEEHPELSEMTEGSVNKVTSPAGAPEQIDDNHSASESASPEPPTESAQPTAEAAAAAAVVAAVVAAAPAAAAAAAAAAVADDGGDSGHAKSPSNEHNEPNHPDDKHNEPIEASVSATKERAAERKKVATEMSQAPSPSIDSLNDSPVDQKGKNDASQSGTESTEIEKEKTNNTEEGEAPEEDGTQKDIAQKDSTDHTVKPVTVAPANTAPQTEQLVRTAAVSEEQPIRKDELSYNKSEKPKTSKPTRKISWQERVVVAESFDCVDGEAGDEEAEAFTPLSPVLEYTPSPPLYRRNTLEELVIVADVPNSESKREVKIQQRRKLSRKESKFRQSRSRSSSEDPESPTPRDYSHGSEEHPLQFALEAEVSDAEKRTPNVAAVVSELQMEAALVQPEEKDKNFKEDSNQKETVKDTKQEKSRKISFIEKLDVIEVPVTKPEQTSLEEKFDRHPKLVIQDSIDEPSDWIHTPLSESKKELEVLGKVCEEDEEKADAQVLLVDSDEALPVKDEAADAAKEAISTETASKPSNESLPEKSPVNEEKADDGISSSRIVERSKLLQKNRILSMSTSSSDTDEEQTVCAAEDQKRKKRRSASSSGSSSSLNDRHDEMCKPKSKTPAKNQQEVATVYKDGNGKSKSASSDSSRSSSDDNDAEKEALQKNKTKSKSASSSSPSSSSDEKDAKKKALQKKMTKSKSARSSNSSSSSDDSKAKKSELQKKRTKTMSTTSSSSSSSSEDSDAKEVASQKENTNSNAQSKSQSSSASSSDTSSSSDNENTSNGKYNKEPVTDRISKVAPSSKEHQEKNKPTSSNDSSSSSDTGDSETGKPLKQEKEDGKEHVFPVKEEQIEKHKSTTSSESVVIPGIESKMQEPGVEASLPTLGQQPSKNKNVKRTSERDTSKPPNDQLTERQAPNDSAPLEVKVKILAEEPIELVQQIVPKAEVTKEVDVSVDISLGQPLPRSRWHTAVNVVMTQLRLKTAVLPNCAQKRTKEKPASQEAPYSASSSDTEREIQQEGKWRSPSPEMKATKKDASHSEPLHDNGKQQDDDPPTDIDKDSDFDVVALVTNVVNESCGPSSNIPGKTQDTQMSADKKQADKEQEPVPTSERPKAKSHSSSSSESSSSSDDSDVDGDTTVVKPTDAVDKGWDDTADRRDRKEASSDNDSSQHYDGTKTARNNVETEKTVDDEHEPSSTAAIEEAVLSLEEGGTEKVPALPKVESEERVPCEEAVIVETTVDDAGHYGGKQDETKTTIPNSDASNTSSDENADDSEKAREDKNSPENKQADDPSGKYDRRRSTSGSSTSSSNDSDVEQDKTRDKRTNAVKPHEHSEQDKEKKEVSNESDSSQDRSNDEDTRNEAESEKSVENGKKSDIIAKLADLVLQPEEKSIGKVSILPEIECEARVAQLEADKVETEKENDKGDRPSRSHLEGTSSSDSSSLSDNARDSDGKSQQKKITKLSRKETESASKRRDTSKSTSSSSSSSSSDDERAHQAKKSLVGDEERAAPNEKRQKKMFTSTSSSESSASSGDGSETKAAAPPEKDYPARDRAGKRQKRKSKSSTSSASSSSDSGKSSDEQNKPQLEKRTEAHPGEKLKPQPETASEHQRGSSLNLSESETKIGKQDGCVAEMQEIIPSQKTSSPEKVVIVPEVACTVRAHCLEADVTKTEKENASGRKHDENVTKISTSSDSSSAEGVANKVQKERVRSDSSTSSDADGQKQRKETKTGTAIEVEPTSKHNRRKLKSASEHDSNSSSDSENEEGKDKSRGTGEVQVAPDTERPGRKTSSSSSSDSCSSANKAIRPHKGETSDPGKVLVDPDSHHHKEMSRSNSNESNPSSDEADKPKEEKKSPKDRHRSKSRSPSSSSSSSDNDIELQKKTGNATKKEEIAAREHHKTSDKPSSPGHSSSSCDDDNRKDSAKPRDKKDTDIPERDKSILSLDFESEIAKQVHKSDEKSAPSTPIVLQPHMASQFIVAEECLSSDSEEEAQEVAICIDAVQPSETVERRLPLFPYEKTSVAKEPKDVTTAPDVPEGTIDLVLVKKEENTFAKPPKSNEETDQVGFPGSQKEQAASEMTKEAEPAENENQEAKSTENIVPELERTRQHKPASVQDKGLPVPAPKDESSFFQEPVLDVKSSTRYWSSSPTKETTQEKVEPSAVPTTPANPRPNRKYSDQYSNFETPRDPRYRLEDMQTRSKSYLGQQTTRSRPQYEVTSFVLPCLVEVRTRETPTGVASPTSETTVECIEQDTPKEPYDQETQEISRVDVEPDKTTPADLLVPRDGAKGRQGQTLIADKHHSPSPSTTSSSSRSSSESEEDKLPILEKPAEKEQWKSPETKRRKKSKSSTSSNSSSSSDSEKENTQKKRTPSKGTQEVTSDTTEHKKLGTTRDSSSSSDSQTGKHEEKHLPAEDKHRVVPGRTHRNKSKSGSSKTSSSSDDTSKDELPVKAKEDKTRKADVAEVSKQERRRYSSSSSSDSTKENEFCKDKENITPAVVGDKSKTSETSSDSSSSSDSDADKAHHKKPKVAPAPNREVAPSTEHAGKMSKTTSSSNSSSSSDSEHENASVKKTSGTKKEDVSPPKKHRKNSKSSTSGESTSSSSDDENDKSRGKRPEAKNKRRSSGDDRDVESKEKPKPSKLTSSSNSSTSSDSEPGKALKEKATDATKKGSPCPKKHRNKSKSSASSDTSSSSSDSENDKLQRRKRVVKDKRSSTDDDRKVAPMSNKGRNVSKSTSSSESSSSSDSESGKTQEKKTNDKQEAVPSKKQRNESRSSSSTSSSSSSSDSEGEKHKKKQTSSKDEKEDVETSEQHKKKSRPRSSSSASSKGELPEEVDEVSLCKEEAVEIIKPVRNHSSSSSSSDSSKRKELIQGKEQFAPVVINDNAKTSEALKDPSSSSDEDKSSHGAPAAKDKQQEPLEHNTGNALSDVVQPDLTVVPPPISEPPQHAPLVEEILEIIEQVPETSDIQKHDGNAPGTLDSGVIEHKVDDAGANKEHPLSPEQKTLDDWVIVPKPADDTRAAPKVDEDEELQTRTSPNKQTDLQALRPERPDSPGEEDLQGQHVSEWVHMWDAAIDSGLYPTPTADVSQRLQELHPDSSRPESADPMRPRETEAVPKAEDELAGLCFAQPVQVINEEDDPAVRAESVQLHEDDVFVDKDAFKRSVSSVDGAFEAILVNIEPEQLADGAESQDRKGAPGLNQAEEEPIADKNGDDETYQASLCFIDTGPSSPTGRERRRDDQVCPELLRPGDTCCEETLPVSAREPPPVVWRRASVDRQVGKFNITCIIRPNEAQVHGSETKPSLPKSTDRKWLNLENYTIMQPPKSPEKTRKATEDEDEILGSKTTVYLAPRTPPNVRQELVALRCVRNSDDESSLTYLPEMRDLTPDVGDSEGSDKSQGSKASDKTKLLSAQSEPLSADIKQRRLAYENESPTTFRELRKVTPPHNANLEERKQKLLGSTTDIAFKAAPPVAVQGKVGRLRAMFEQMDAEAAQSPGRDDNLRNARRFKSMVNVAPRAAGLGTGTGRWLEEPTLKERSRSTARRERSRSTVALHRPEEATGSSDAVDSGPLKERSRSTAGLNRTPSGTFGAELSIAPGSQKEYSRSTVDLHRPEGGARGEDAVDSGPMKERSRSTAGLNRVHDDQGPAASPILATLTNASQVRALSKSSGALATAPSPPRDPPPSPPSDFVTLDERTLSSRALDHLEGSERQAKLDAIRRYFEGLQDGDITTGDDTDMLDDALVPDPGYNRSLPRLDVSASDPRPPLSSLFSGLETESRQQRLNRSASSPLFCAEGEDSPASLLEQVRQLRRRASGGALSQASLATSLATSTSELAQHRDDGIVVFGPGMLQGKVNAVNRFQILVPHPDQAPLRVRVYSPRTDSSTRAELRDLRCNYHQVAYWVSQPGWYRLHVRLGGGARHVDLMTKVSH